MDKIYRRARMILSVSHAQLPLSDELDNARLRKRPTTTVLESFLDSDAPRFPEQKNGCRNLMKRAEQEEAE